MSERTGNRGGGGTKASDVDGGKLAPVMPSSPGPAWNEGARIADDNVCQRCGARGARLDLCGRCSAPERTFR